MNIICNVYEVCFLWDKTLVDEDSAFTGYDAKSLG